MATDITQILDRADHDAVVEQSKHTPTVIYVSNSVTPACRDFSPEFESLVQRHADTEVRFCQMEITNKTSMMFKFAPNQLPVTVLMVRDAWAKTVMGPDIRGLERSVEELIAATKKLLGEKDRSSGIAVEALGSCFNPEIVSQLKGRP